MIQACSFDFHVTYDLTNSSFTRYDPYTTKRIRKIIDLYFMKVRIYIQYIGIYIYTHTLCGSRRITFFMRILPEQNDNTRVLFLISYVLIILA